jgi:ferric-dicitrate binding protein FerR (iron transport regulator)
LTKIEDAAARWILLREEPGWSGQDETLLEAWLSDCDANRAAFYRLEAGWRRADRIAALGGENRSAPAIFATDPPALQAESIEKDRLAVGPEISPE